MKHTFGRLKEYCCVLIFFISQSIFSQTSGSLDLSFSMGHVTGTIYCTALQADGKIIIAGYFSTIEGINQSCIARLNIDGSLDDINFNIGTGVGGGNRHINTILIQPDGKIIIAGLFNNYNGVDRHNIARLNSDGGLDLTFDPGDWQGAEITSIALQEDNKILIGGPMMSEYNNNTVNNIVRINSDGSYDNTFIPEIENDPNIFKIIPLPNGKILAGIGYFGLDQPLNAIIRLNANGSNDDSFLTGRGTNNHVHSVVVQPDGKILIGGWFTSYNGVTRNYITRLNSDGSLDTTFNSDGPETYSESVNILLQPDGKIIVLGDFNTYNGVSRKHIARLYTDGTLDTTFDPGMGDNGSYINTALLQPDGKILIGGDFSSYNSIEIGRMARIYGGEILKNETLNTRSLTYYPNPINNVLNISSKSEVNKIEIYNIMGQIVLSRKNNGLDATIDTSTLAPSGYFVKVYSKNSSENFSIIKN